MDPPRVECPYCSSADNCPLSIPLPASRPSSPEIAQGINSVLEGVINSTDKQIPRRKLKSRSCPTLRSGVWEKSAQSLNGSRSNDPDSSHNIFLKDQFRSEGTVWEGRLRRREEDEDPTTQPEDEQTTYRDSTRCSQTASGSAKPRSSLKRNLEDPEENNRLGKRKAGSRRSQQPTKYGRSIIRQHSADGGTVPVSRL